MSVCVNDTNGDGDCAACARNPEAPCRVSARERLLNFIASNEPDDGKRMGFDEEAGLLWGDEYVAHAGKLLDAYAHELAEKIRNSKELRDLTDDHMSDCNAADVPKT